MEVGAYRRAPPETNPRRRVHSGPWAERRYWTVTVMEVVSFWPAESVTVSFTV